MPGPIENASEEGPYGEWTRSAMVTFKLLCLRPLKFRGNVLQTKQQVLKISGDRYTLATRGGFKRGRSVL